jgi:AcrR family transcriptional regulator
MPSRDVGAEDDASAGVERRPYDSPLRRERAANTRARILSAGSELVHGFPSWDWRNLTFRAVAERAEISERTVYRHFTTEQELHRAVMQRLEQEAGVSYDDIGLDDIASVAERAFAAISSFSALHSELEPLFAEEDRHRRESLLAAVTSAAPEWSKGDQEKAAAILDVLWAAGAYERLMTIWGLKFPDATQAAAWAISLVKDAVQNDQRPSSLSPRRKIGARGVKHPPRENQ